jgi:CspA family cold shock protein
MGEACLRFVTTQRGVVASERPCPRTHVERALLQPSASIKTRPFSDRGDRAALTAVVLRRNTRHEMATGTVKWFNDAKGFGFITQDGGGEDVFCHHTAIQSEGFRTLAEGQKVEFDVARGPKGLQAQNVKPI